MQPLKVIIEQNHPHGEALIASMPITRGEVVATFDGEFYHWGSNLLLLPNDPPRYVRDHAIQYAPGKSRDSLRGLGRYANHSCMPNCGIQNLFDLVAMEDISVGTEITWDYAMTENNDWFMMCQCGSPNCRGVITGYRNLPPEIRLKYAGFISQWLVDKDIPYEGHAVVPQFSDEPISNVSKLPTMTWLHPSMGRTAPRAS